MRLASCMLERFMQGSGSIPDPAVDDGPWCQGASMLASRTGPDRQSGLRAMGRALANRNYRLFFAGQGVSLIGTWMTRLATGWLVFRLAGEHAPWLLGAV